MWGRMLLELIFEKWKALVSNLPKVFSSKSYKIISKTYTFKTQPLHNGCFWIVILIDTRPIEKWATNLILSYCVFKLSSVWFIPNKIE